MKLRILYRRNRISVAQCMLLRMFKIFIKLNSELFILEMIFLVVIQHRIMYSGLVWWGFLFGQHLRQSCQALTELYYRKSDK